MLAVHAVCADTEDEARRQLAPVHVMYRNLSAGRLDIPIPGADTAVEELGGLPKLDKYIPESGILPKFIGGTPDSVKEQLEQIAADFAVGEIMIQDMIMDQKARLHSYALMAAAFQIKPIK